METEAASTSEQSGCQHYSRNCKLVAPCCNKVYPCRFCHDEDNESHAINRKLVREVVCSKCETRQACSERCSKCSVVFGNYVCLICNLFDMTDRKQFHCPDCGMCRVGGRDNYYHCKVCDMCLPNKLKDTHKCIEKVAHDNCAVCLENLHESRIPSHIPPCGHLIHTSCYDRLTEAGHYACPLCGVSMMDMSILWKQMDREIEDTPMPEEYRTVQLYVLCKDCHKESKVLYHIIGLKCGQCGSYNTCRSKNPDRERDGSTGTDSDEAHEGEEDEDDETLTLTITPGGHASSNGVSNIEIAMETLSRPADSANNDDDTDEDCD